jgi:hypothetical protein
MKSRRAGCDLITGQVRQGPVLVSARAIESAVGGKLLTVHLSGDTVREWQLHLIST